MYLNKTVKDFEVVPFKDDRFCIVETKTGKVIDDRFGNGFRSEKNAVDSLLFELETANSGFYESEFTAEGFIKRLDDVVYETAQNGDVVSIEHIKDYVSS